MCNGSEQEMVPGRSGRHTEEVAFAWALHGVQAQGRERGCDVSGERHTLGLERVWGSEGCLGTCDVLLMKVWTLQAPHGRTASERATAVPYQTQSPRKPAPLNQGRRRKSSHHRQPVIPCSLSTVSPAEAVRLL